MNNYSQNFLLKTHLVNRLLEKSNIQKGDTVIDIGAGDGMMTILLAQKVGNEGKIIAIENDKKLIPLLKNNSERFSNIEILEESILRYHFPRIEYKTFSNIPFNITSEIFNKILSPESKLQSGYIIVQAEAAKMYGGSQLNSFTTLKSLLHYPFYEINNFFRFKGSDFIPFPRVNIDMVEILRRKNPLINPSDSERFNTFISVIAKDRVDEGVWRLIFNKEERKKTIYKSGLISNKGIKTQNEDAFVKAFLYLKQIKKDEWFKGIKSEIPKQKDVKKIHRTRKDKTWSKN